MGKKKAKKQVDAAIAPQPQQQRNYKIPGCNVEISSNDDDGVAIDQFLAIAFNLAASNPDARVQFGVRVLGDA